MVAEKGFEPHDLRVMSPASYQTAPLRDILVPEAGVEPVRDKISRDFKSRASANSAIPAFFRPAFQVCHIILSQDIEKVNTLEQNILKSELKANCRGLSAVFCLTIYVELLLGVC